MKTKKTIKVAEKNYFLHISIYAWNLSPVIVSDCMSGKMEDIPSISTSCLLNTHCQQYRKIEGSICQKCFAHATINRYSGLSKNLESNYYLLTTSVLDEDLLPKFNEELAPIVRFESFGDIENETQVINYVNICRKNPNIIFALWTKNPHIVSKAFDKVGKPENLILIQSSIMINDIVKAYNEYIDKVFTVYDKKGQKGININCGARHCFTCRRCYTVKDAVEYISEALK